jgi:lysyl-tRNA synthetase class 2
MLAARALRPWSSGGTDDPVARARAARIVAEQATDTLAPFTLRADKQFFFGVEGTSFVAYRVVAGVALVSGDPVGDESTFAALVAAFARFVERRGWTLGVLGASPQRLPLWRNVGLRAHYTGDEAVVDPAAFSLEGRAIRKVRQSVTRLERAGYVAQVLHSGAIDEPLASRIAEIAARWRGDRGETGYSMAFAGAAVDRTRDDLYVIARDAAGEPRGFLHFGVVPGALSLSSMRRERDTPNGLNEFLICRALEYARDNGIGRVSLNFAAFALVLDPPAPLDPLSRVERRLLARLAQRFQLERLLSFSEKFSPTWTPRYAAYPSIATLPRIALAAMLAEAYVTLPSAPWRPRR